MPTSVLANCANIGTISIRWMRLVIVILVTKTISCVSESLGITAEGGTVRWIIKPHSRLKMRFLQLSNLSLHINIMQRENVQLFVSKVLT